MENIDDKAAADALLVVVRRIEAMPGSWHSLTGETRGHGARHRLGSQRCS